MKSGVRQFLGIWSIGII